MKKIIALLSALVLCLCLGACGGQASSTAASASAPASEGSSSSAIADGTYPIKIETDSSMVHVVDGKLIVKDGVMTVSMSLNGEGFSRLYLGNKEDAAKAQDSDIYDYTLNDAGKYTFVFPVESLDTDVSVALYGQRRDEWYDHVLVFNSPSAGAGSGAVDTSGSLDQHTIEVTLEGGTGKASIESPAKIIVAPDGSMTATIVWSSPNYDLMIVDGVEYTPVPRAGNSTFDIPVKALDQDIAIQARTTAMSEPHLIDYKLHFDSSSMK